MPFEIIRNDITRMQVDAIVNSANPEPTIGFGTDADIHQKAGPELLAARLKIGSIRPGHAAITPGFDLAAKYVIHTVGPVWQGGGHREEALLRACYVRSLKLAKQHCCQSIAFPLISTGNYGFPKPLALQTAMDAIREFLVKNEMQVYLVVFTRDAFQLSEGLFHGVSSFIDETYIQQKDLQQHEIWGSRAFRERREALTSRQQPCQSPAPGDALTSACFRTATPPQAAAPAPQRRIVREAKPSLAQLLAETDAGFSETLLTLIDRAGKKDSEIYTRANVSRQHFSKIRNNPAYKPTKATAIAFAIALELDLEQTRDLIGRAGYALTNSSKFDVIIMYFIRERNYNLFDINAALFEFDQSLLGA